MGSQHSESIGHLLIGVLIGGYFAGHHLLMEGKTLEALAIFGTSCVAALMFAVSLYLIGELQEKSRHRAPRARKQQSSDQTDGNTIVRIRR